MADQKHCAICGFELTDNDLNYASPMDYWTHCKDHSNHATYPQLWLLKKELGMAYEEPKQDERVCAVCGLHLSDEEMISVKKEHCNIVCTFHKRAAFDVNIQMTREKLGYGQFLRRPIDTMIKTWNL
jgi:hypothetical protein